MTWPTPKPLSPSRGHRPHGAVRDRGRVARRSTWTARAAPHHRPAHLDAVLSRPALGPSGPLLQHDTGASAGAGTGDDVVRVVSAGRGPRRAVPVARVVVAGVLALVGLVVLAGPARAGEPGVPEAPTQSPDDVRQAADDVLARPEFRRPEPNVVEKATSWLEEQFGRALQRLTSGNGASLIGWGVMLAAIAAIVFLLARFSRTVQVDPRRSATVSIERARSAAEWDAEAERFERDAAWKPALRCRFRALVATMVDRGQVDDVPGRTAGEYRVEVAMALPEVSGAFAEATVLFEDAWYGDRPTGARENARFRELAAAVRDASSAHPSAGPGATAVAEAVPA